MSLQPPRDPWSRLTAVAREVRDERATTAPYGFSTRVAALALTQERDIGSVFGRFAFRALGIASLLALGSVALNYNAITVPAANAVVAINDVVSSTTPADDAVALVFDVAD